MRVQAVLNHEVLGEAVANMPRPDLAAAGFGDGNSGYIIRLFRQVDPIYLPFLSVKVADGDAELPRAASSGYREFFSELYRKYPATGRHRSVLGGLWTDRTDSMALLRAKTEIGHVAAASGPAVSQLIHDGVAILRLDGEPAGNWSPNVLADSIADLLDDPAVLPVLRAVLEDNPLVIRANWVTGNETRVTQPSSENPAPSPAECLVLVVASGGGGTLEVVRNSHLLPEFTASGESRWQNGLGAAGLELVGGGGLLDRYDLAATCVAIVGPGTLYRVRGEQDGHVLQIMCLPSRQTPLSLLQSDTRHDVIRPSGARVLL